MSPRGGEPQSDPEVAKLEDDLTALGNHIGVGAMGFAGTSLVVATHVEVAHTHTGGLPVGLHAFCLSSRRARRGSTPTAAWSSAPIRRVHRLLPRGDRVIGPIERLDDVAMDEVRLATPVGDADIARLKLGDVVYLDGFVYTARRASTTESSSRTRPARQRAAPDQRELPLLAGGHRSPGRDLCCGSRHRHGLLPLRPLDDPLVRAHGGESHRGQGRAHGARLPRVVRASHGAVYLTTVGYGLGAAYGKCIKGVREVHWLKELGIAQALWVLEVERLGPFLVEGDHAGRGLRAGQPRDQRPPARGLRRTATVPCAASAKPRENRKSSSPTLLGACIRAERAVPQGAAPGRASSPTRPNAAPRAARGTWGADRPARRDRTLRHPPAPRVHAMNNLG